MLTPAPDGETANGLQFTLVRYFDAPRARVFRMWSEPELFRRWSVPAGFHIAHGASDFRPGGAWRCHMVAPDGTEHRASGHYLEILAPEYIAMSHRWEDAHGQHSPETQLGVSLDALGERTRLILHQGLFASEADRSGHEAGWSECLDTLADQLHALAAHERPG